MNKTDFIEQAKNQLKSMNVLYQIGKKADILISTNLKKQEVEVDTELVIVYYAAITLNEDNNTVYAYEKAQVGNEDIAITENFAMTLVKTDDDNKFRLSEIIGAIALIASSLGFIFVRTDDEKIASYPSGFEADRVYSEVEYNKVKCINCGSVIIEGSNFCTVCGSKTIKTNIPPSHTLQNETHLYQNVKPTIIESKKSQASIKISSKTIIISAILISLIIIGAIIGLIGRNRNENNNTNSSDNTTSVSSKKSSIVSAGVSTSDLGNIMNGQYYFASDKFIFYSSFDENDKAHIYSMKKDGSEHKAIFDGFGWSLVVIDNWLYFSGNQGAEIDGTYNIFRISFDGSKIEKINNEYSYGMFLYDNYLYYMKRKNQDVMSICRSNLDGTNETVLFENGLSPLIYNNQLYYYDNQGNMYRTKPDGSSPQVLLTATVKFYVLSSDKIVYIDNNNNIYTSDLDGKNNKIIRSNKAKPINSINAYNGKVYFTEYSSSFNYTLYGYDYTVLSCNIDGSNEKELFSSVSYGIYMNIVDNKLMLMDYIKNISSGIMYASIKSMNLDGTNLKILDR